MSVTWLHKIKDFRPLIPSAAGPELARLSHGAGVYPMPPANQSKDQFMNVQTTLNFYGRTEEAINFYRNTIEAETLRASSSEFLTHSAPAAARVFGMPMTITGV